MKIVLVLISTFLSSSISFANIACPDFSGYYKLDKNPKDRRILEIEQEGCELLKLRVRWIENDGRLNDARDFRFVWNLDGKQHEECLPFNSCRTYEITASELIIKDKLTLQTTTKHGLCRFNEMRWTKSNDGSIVDSTHVFDCDDGFSGVTQSTMKAYHN